ncbi:MAG TPA: peptidylprolyl isomerase [Candidatus Thermoplasmatota archaeon]|jgi:cyclophilin family peptidyl-prolyl cis-trans isomerase|nr:peptidylprolyl isomerase [Candidatus Thermoplasmatota archaeon]
MSPIEKPRKRVDNPSQKLKKSSRKWMYLALILIVIVIAVVAVVVSQNLLNPKSDNVPEGNPVALFDTDYGTFKVELYQDKMPETVDNFVKLVNDGFYNGVIFHRIGDNFMIQGGGYYSNGTRKTSPYGNIPFETSDVKHVDGAISMASTGAKVGGAAEFFICDGAQTFLDGNYAAFGVVIEGLDVVRTIAAQPHPDGGDGTGKPDSDIVINNIIIIGS